MPARRIASLAITLSANAAGVRRGFSDARGATSRFGRDLKEGRSQVRGFTVGLSKMAAVAGGVVAGITAVVGSFRSMFETINRLDAIGDMAARLSIGVGELQRLSFAAEDTGSDMTTLTSSLRRMVRRVAEARQGLGEARGVLKDLGLSAGELAQQRPEEMFKRIADAIAGVEDPAEQLRIAFKIFDTEGAALLPLLRQGSEGINRLGDELEQLGGVMSEDQVAAATEARMAMTRLRLAWQGAKDTAAIALAPALTALANTLRFLLKIVQAVQGGFQLLNRILTGTSRAAGKASLDALGESGRSAAAGIGAVTEEMKKQQEEAEQARKKIIEQGEALTASLATPMERIQQEVQAAVSLWKSGAITIETYRRAVAKAGRDLRGIAEQQQKLKVPDFSPTVSAVERGTAAASIAIAESRREQQEQIRNQQRQIAVQIETNRLLAEIERNTTFDPIEIATSDLGP